MEILDLIRGKFELTESKTSPEAIVLSTRIRLARNLEKYPFPAWAKVEVREEVRQLCQDTLLHVEPLIGGNAIDFGVASDMEKQVLMERHLISPEFAQQKKGSGLVFSKDQSCAVMVNEEDHLRIQVVRNGYKLKPAWKVIDQLDNYLEKELNYAYSPELGYLTACPTNIGTGMRASAMLHLPGLVIIGQIERVVRACSQLNLAVRGIYGEGTEASGSIFQISNQQTLGECETKIIKRLMGVLDTVIEQEVNARRILVEREPTKIFDKIGRAHGILCNGYFVNSVEALNLLSLMRLGVDLNVVNKKYRRMIDRLIIESQPGHIQAIAGKLGETSDQRDIYRANLFREKFRTIEPLHFDDVQT